MMDRTTQHHQLIIANTLAVLHHQLRGTGYWPTCARTGVRTGETTIRYPDLVVDCGPRVDQAMCATAWLQKKKGFLASIWHEADTTAEPQDAGETVAPEHMIFVPVARDGSMFTPDLLRNGGYRIGAKGAEEDVADFSTALARLNAMPVPRWRRPNENGVWGIVSGVAWQRIEKK